MVWYLWVLIGITIGWASIIGSIVGFSYIVMHNDRLTQKFGKRMMAAVVRHR